MRDDVAVELVTFQPMTLPAAGPDASGILAGFLAERDVSVSYRRTVSAADGAKRTLSFQDGEPLDYSVLLGVPAEKVPPAVEDGALAGASGFVEPDRTTLRTAFTGVYAVGDCTAVPTATAQLPKSGVFAAAQGTVAARNLAHQLYGSAEASFDGQGSCFLELPGGRVAMVEGDFFAEPRPDVRVTEPTEANFALKQRYELDRLAEWLG